MHAWRFGSELRATERHIPQRADHSIDHLNARPKKNKEEKTTPDTAVTSTSAACFRAAA